MNISIYSLHDGCIKYQQITSDVITESYLINLALNRKIKLIVLYDGRLGRIDGNSEEIVDYYGWLVPLPRFYAELIANGSSKINMLTNLEESATFKLIDGISKGITINKDNLFITDSTINHLAGFRPVNNKAKGRRDNQIALIQNYIKEKDWEALNLPSGAKKAIEDYCLAAYPQNFTDNGFDHAWKVGLKNNLFRLKDHEKYSAKKGRH